uniref:MalT-like TPR region domain-containing protein n=1 Tax=Odontella aurita TaxID=265563 RepID=A0A6U6DQI2_9STRA|mmetsp:Transcript_21880/g.64589  ORF Transcript_21880/g.64589 Transcript_21880/m.64589 type:complete len:521 (+) Transcript_21880:122-1684(+)
MIHRTQPQHEQKTLRQLDQAASLINVGAAHQRSGDAPEVASRHYADAVRMSLQTAECSSTGLRSASERTTRLRKMAVVASASLDSAEMNNSKSSRKRSRHSARLLHQSRLIGLYRRTEPLSISSGYGDVPLSRAEADARSDEDCAVALFNASLLRLDAGRPEDASELLHLAVEASRSDIAAPSDVTIASITTLGYSLYLQGKYSAAATAYDSLVRFFRSRIEAIRRDGKITMASAEATEAIRNMVRYMTSLARTYDAMGQVDEAALIANEASHLLSTVENAFEGQTEKSSDDSLALMYAQAVIRQNRREYDLAIMSYKSIVANAGEMSRDNEAILASALHGIGECLLIQRKSHECEPYLLGALTIRRDILGEMHEDVADNLYLIGRALQRREEYVDAISCYEKALCAWKETQSAADTNILLVLRDMARANRSRNDLGGALDCCKEGLDALQGSHIGNCAVRLSLLESLVKMETALLEEAARTDAILSGCKVQKRPSKPGSYIHEEASHGWIGRCPDAAAA